MTPKGEASPPGKPERLAIFQPEFREDLRYWVEVDRKVALRALSLIEAILRDPFTGIGKPEPLKHLASGAWSRRLTQEHRIVYLPKGNRRIYKLWEEGRVPCMVIELTSDSTRQEDLETKKSCYARLGVEEYFIHDPLGDYLEPPLQGFRLESGQYRRIAPASDGSLEIRSLGLKLRKEGERSRLIDAGTGEPLSRPDEAYRQARELARLRKELERLRG